MSNNKNLHIFNIYDVKFAGRIEQENIKLRDRLVCMRCAMRDVML